MAVTTVEDLTEALNTPFAKEWFQKYTTENSALYRSGIIATDPQIQKLVTEYSARGKTGELNFFNDLGSEDQGQSQTVPFAPDKFTGGKDAFVIHRRGKAWAAHDLAGIITGGGDVVGNARTLMADFQIRARQRMLMHTLKGVFASNIAKNSGDLVFDITGLPGEAAFLDEDSLLDAAQVLGDAKGALAAIVCHSAVETHLNKIGRKSQTYQPADQRQGVLASFNGKSLIMDDTLPFNKSTGVAEFFMFARGAVAEASAEPAENNRRFENYREALKSTSGIIARDSYVMHIRGVKYVGSTDADTPSEETIESAASWTRVYEQKHIRVLKIIAKVRAVGGGGGGGDSSGTSGASASA